LIIYNSKVPKLLKAEGLTIFPLIWVVYSKEKCPGWLLNHEKVHIKQQKKWLLFPWFAIYGCDYLWGRFKNMSHDEAYRNTRFEKDAYSQYSPE
jgi:hypothetical protein